MDVMFAMSNGECQEITGFLLARLDGSSRIMIQILLLLLASTLVDAHAIVGGPTNWTPTVDGPRARWGHATASLGNGKVLMYGGFGMKGKGPLSETYIFALSTNEKTGEETGTWTNHQLRAGEQQQLNDNVLNNVIGNDQKGIKAWMSKHKITSNNGTLEMLSKIGVECPDDMSDLDDEDVEAICSTLKKISAKRFRNALLQKTRDTHGNKE